MNINENNDVSHVSNTINKWLADTALPRTLYAGGRAMREAGEAFLPQHTLESNKSYSERLRVTVLLNAYKKTCSFLAGQVFQRNIAWTDATNDIIQEWAASIDTAGNSIDVFAKRVFQTGIGKGAIHILVDMPKKTEDIKTKADENAAGLRPYFRMVEPEDILGYVLDEEKGIIQVRIKESVEVPVGKYGMRIEERVRVLFPGGWEVWLINDKRSNTIIDSGTYPDGVLPLVSFIPGDATSPVTGIPPMDDLAELNGKHWRSTSDQTTILSVARVPIIFGRMIDLAMLDVGSKAMVASDEEGADMKFVEHSGAAIAAGAEDLRSIEAQMALYGLQQLIPRSGNQTATEKALTSSESNSSLGTWATEFQDSLDRAFLYASTLAAVPYDEDSLSVNQEYNLGVMGSEEVKALLETQRDGIITERVCFDEIKRRGFFAETLFFDDMEADKEQEKRDSLAMIGGFGDGDTGAGDEE